MMMMTMMMIRDEETMIDRPFWSDLVAHARANGLRYVFDLVP